MDILYQKLCKHSAKYTLRDFIHSSIDLREGSFILRLFIRICGLGAPSERIVPVDFRAAGQRMHAVGRPGSMAVTASESFFCSTDRAVAGRGHSFCNR